MAAKTTKDYSRGYLIAVVSSVFLSTTAIFIRHLTQTYQLPPMILAFWRDIFVVITLLPVFMMINIRLLKPENGNIRYLILYGFVLAFFNSAWTFSVAVNGAAIATVLVYSSVGFTTLLGWWFLKEKVNWVKCVAVSLTFMGCFLISGVTSQNSSQNLSLFGICIGLLSGLCYAMYSLMGRSASQRNLNPWTTLFYTFGFAAIFLLVYNLIPVSYLPGSATNITGLFWLGNSFSGWLVLFLLAAVPTVAGFGLYNVSLVYLPSSVANLIVTFEPVFTGIIAFFILGERLTGLQMIGSGLILAGVLFLRLFDDRIHESQNTKSEILISKD